MFLVKIKNIKIIYILQYVKHWCKKHRKGNFCQDNHRCLTVSVWPFSAAKCSGVLSSLSFALTSMLSFFSNNSTISVWPYWAAKCSGVLSSLSFALTSAPLLISSITLFKSPSLAACISCC